MEKLINKLNTEQRQAVTHKDGPLLIVAGAGTGKTTVITQRIAWLIEQGLAKPEEILALTFTEKAAAEMEERVDKALPYGYVNLWISTFHSFGERILRDYGLEIGLPNEFKILSQTGQWLLIRQNLDRFNLDYYRPLGNPSKFIHALIKHFSRAKDECLEPKDYLEYAKNIKLDKDLAEAMVSSAEAKKQKLTEKELEEIKIQEVKRINEIADAFHVYQQLLLDNEALDFGDLINYCLKLFQKRPKILKKFRDHFKYILIDEFQDTNYAQYELIKILAGPSNNITVVGDDDQSIYKFRGASISNILEFKKDYHGSKEICLVTNYRSCQNILDLSYKFIQQNNPNRLEVRLKGKKKISKKLISASKKRGVIEYHNLNSLDDEILRTVQKITEIKSWDKAALWSDFAILVRANESAIPFTIKLEEAGIPYQFLASRGLYSKTVILDLICYLKLLGDYHESTAMFRVLSLPVLGISQIEISRINYLARKKSWSLYEALQKSGSMLELEPLTREKINVLLGNIAVHSRQAKERGVRRVIMSFLDDFGYLDYIKKLEEQKQREYFNYLNQFYRQVQEFERSSPDDSLKAFMEELDYVLESGDQGSMAPDLEEGPEQVKVMTVHASKGLEFKYVFIPGLVDKRFPTIERKEPIEIPDELVKEIIPEGDIHLQEERRLFYVAMTRAKRGLYLSSATDYGGLRKKKPSSFLIELEMAPEAKLKPGTIERQAPEISNGQILTEHENRLPKWFSFTQLRAFENCPYQYRFAHILRVPTKGKAVFSYGKSIHRTLERFFRLVLERQGLSQNSLFGEPIQAGNKGKRLKVSLKEFLELFDQYWIEDWFDDKNQIEEYKKKGQASLKEYYFRLKKKLPDIIYLEQEFSLKVGGYTVKGVIDRVDRLSGNKIEIVDYKTGGKKEKLSAEDKEQLLIYQLAVKEVYGLDPERLTYYYIDDNFAASFLGNEKELKSLENKIVRIVEKLKVSDFSANPGMLCKYCDFKQICEYRKL